MVQEVIGAGDLAGTVYKYMAEWRNPGKRVSLFCVVNQGDGSCDGSWYKVIGALGDPIGETVPVIGQVNIKGTVQGNGGWHLLC